MNELKRVYGDLLKAITAEDVFGRLSSGEIEDQLAELQDSYRQLKNAVLPDAHKDNQEFFEIAHEATDILEKFYKEAETKILNGNYDYFFRHGRDDEIKFIIKKPEREYYIKSQIAEGDISTVYSGYCSLGDSNIDSIVVKILNDPQDFDLMQNEIKLIKLLQKEPSRQSKHLPVLLDQFLTDDGKMGLIMHKFNGYDFYSVREHEKYLKGVPQKHAVWMLNRLLSVLGYAHSKAIIHGNIEPAHLMIRPRDHNLLLLDWSYGAEDPFNTGDGFKVFNEDFSAPEVQEKKLPVPASDLYSVGKCIIYILGGDIKTNEMPDTVDEPLQRFIKFFVRKSPLQRAQDAWRMHGRLVKLVEGLWGPRKFSEFEM